MLTRHHQPDRIVDKVDMSLVTLRFTADKQLEQGFQVTALTLGMQPP